MNNIIEFPNRRNNLNYIANGILQEATHIHEASIYLLMAVIELQLSVIKHLIDGNVKSKNF